MDLCVRQVPHVLTSCRQISVKSSFSKWKRCKQKPVQCKVDRSPSIATVNRSPSIATANRSPSIATVNRSPSIAAVNRSPSIAAVDRSPSNAAVDRSPFIATADRSPSNAFQHSKTIRQSELLHGSGPWQCEPKFPKAARAVLFITVDVWFMLMSVLKYVLCTDFSTHDSESKPNRLEIVHSFCCCNMDTSEYPFLIILEEALSRCTFIAFYMLLLWIISIMLAKIYKYS